MYIHLSNGRQNDFLYDTQNSKVHKLAINMKGDAVHNQNLSSFCKYLLISITSLFFQQDNLFQLLLTPMGKLTICSLMCNRQIPITNYFFDQSPSLYSICPSFWVNKLLIIKMNQNKAIKRTRVNFSNVYSPGSQLLLRNKRSKSKTISPQARFQPKINKDLLTNIPNITIFRQTNKIALKNKTENLFQRLQTQAVAKRRYDQRVKRNNLYLNYDYNPFTNNLHSASTNSGYTHNRHENSHLIYQYNKLRNKISKDQDKSKLKQTTNVQRKVTLLKTPLKPNYKQQQHQRSINTEIQPSPIDNKNYLREQFSAFEEIINRKQQRFISNGQDQKNIFAILFQTNNRNFKSHQYQLDKHFFCLDSMLTSHDQRQGKRWKVSPLMDISSYSRKIIKNISITGLIAQRFILTPSDINTDLDQVIFKDIILVATNKIQSAQLSHYLQGIDTSINRQALAQKTQEINNKVQQVPQVLNHHKKSVNFQLIDQNKIDLSYYNEAAYTRVDHSQRQISMGHIDTLKKIVRLQANAREHTIKDKAFLMKIQQQKNKILLKHLDSNADHRLKQLMNEQGRKIRMNKTSKNRAQKIKIDLLCQSLRIQASIHNADKSKSPATARTHPLR